MTSATPIFDQLVDEFNRSGQFVFGYVYQSEEPCSELETLETPVETPTNLKTHNTLLDATHLKTIRPAIPEYASPTVDKPDPEATQEMDAVDMPTTVMERLREADKELGLDEWDEAFEKAAEKVPERPTAVITMPKKATPEDVRKMQETVNKSGNKYEVKIEEAPKPLPRRRNKRTKKPRANANAGGKQDFSFFETDTTDSPRSAA